MLLESNEKLTVKPNPLNCTRTKVKQIMDFVTCYILTDYHLLDVTSCNWVVTWISCKFIPDFHASHFRRGSCSHRQDSLKSCMSHATYFYSICLISAFLLCLIKKVYQCKHTTHVHTFICNKGHAGVHTRMWKLMSCLMTKQKSEVICNAVSHSVNESCV